MHQIKLEFFQKIDPITIGEKTIIVVNIEQIPVIKLSIHERKFPRFSLMYLLVNPESKTR